MSQQITFPWPMDVTKAHPDGRREELRYGQYESVMITKENGFSVDRSQILAPPRHFVTDVECEDGTKLIFDEPWYVIECGGRGD